MANDTGNERNSDLFKRRVHQKLIANAISPTTTRGLNSLIRLALENGISPSEVLDIVEAGRNIRHILEDGAKGNRSNDKEGQ